MNRVRVNFAGGQLTADPGSSGTTLSSLELVNLPVVTLDVDYIPIVLDPHSEYGDPEIVYITEHTSLSSSATIVRGQEGTTGIAHDVDTYWICAPLAADFDDQWLSKSPDNPANYGADLGYDYEFNAESTSLPSGFSWFNQGSATYEEKFGAGTITAPANSAIGWRGLVMNDPASSWELTTKNGFLGKDGTESANGIVLRESGSGELITLYWYSIGTYQSNVYLVHWASPTDTSPSVIEGPINLNPHEQVRYFKIVKTSSTDYSFYFSQDGIMWGVCLENYDPSGFMTPDEVGFGSYNNTNNGFLFNCSFMRFR